MSTNSVTFPVCLTEEQLKKDNVKYKIDPKIEIPRTFHHKESHVFNQRFDKMGLGFRENQQYVRRSRTNRILLVPPSQKVFNHFGGDAEKYTEKYL